MNSVNYDVDLRYRQIDQLTKEQGLDSKVIELSNQFYIMKNGFSFLKEMAFKPTGIALGNPLPNSNFQNAIFSIAILLEKFLKEKVKIDTPVFAYVPPECYHITLVNFTHFDKDSTIKAMSPQDQRDVQNIIIKRERKRILLTFKGMILTPEGRLIVCGFPTDFSLFDLRDDLLDKFTASNRSHAEYTTHIKIGHLLVDLNGRLFQEFLSKIADQSKELNYIVNFDDLYSPCGRIKLIDSKEDT